MGTGEEGKKEADLPQETRFYSEGYLKSQDSLKYESDKIESVYLKASSTSGRENELKGQEERGSPGWKWRERTDFNAQLSAFYSQCHEGVQKRYLLFYFELFMLKTFDY